MRSLARIAFLGLLVSAACGFSPRKAPKPPVSLQQKLRSAAAAAVLALTVFPTGSVAIGPQVIELSNVKYRDTGKSKGDVCADRPLIPPGEKVAKGLTPKCVLVSATSESPVNKEVADAAVFGYVKTDTGDSAIANNPDFNSDAGQFASIKKVPPGVGKVEFEFVAVIPQAQTRETTDENLKLEFDSLKAISYPGGKRYAP